MENNNQNFEQSNQNEAQEQQPINQPPVDYQQPPQYNPNQYMYNEPLAPVMSVKDWLLTLLVMMIPCVNIIMMFVWAFSKSDNPNKANYFKAYLIYYAISIVLSIAFLIVYVAIFASAFENMATY